MFATRLITDAWEGVHNHETVCDEPSLAQILDAIRRLDQRRHTMVILETGDEPHMIVGGGRDRFVVTSRGRGRRRRRGRCHPGCGGCR